MQLSWSCVAKVWGVFGPGPSRCPVVRRLVSSHANQARSLAPLEWLSAAASFKLANRQCLRLQSIAATTNSAMGLRLVARMAAAIAGPSRLLAATLSRNYVNLCTSGFRRLI